ncbi:hypothetical protein [Aliarcobacter butzleri]|uniref:hypothetical protein n=1 Tax=Aliarcobacter butzleri TaxID=28197 RepID=UPI001269E82C|nr:hypothetical protein [Aliarcobacter butzleri]
MTTNTKIIRLVWTSNDEETFEDFTVPSNTPNKVIRLAIDLALAIGENECEEFENIMNKFGFKAEKRVDVLEVFDFNNSKNEIIDSLYSEIDTLEAIVEKLAKSTNEDKFNIFIKEIDNMDSDPINLDKRILEIAI